jgi:hypothetical protein
MRWAWTSAHTWFVGDGAIAYRRLIVQCPVLEPTPLIAPAVGWIAARLASTGPVPGPDKIRPLYVRRPDAELARDRSSVRADR